MKKILLLFFVAFALNSCSPDDSVRNDLVFLPVEDVIMPTNATQGVITEILVKYKKPTDCYFFQDFYYEVYGFSRIVAIQSIKVNQEVCADVSTIENEVPLKFRPNLPGTYVFKFWTGQDQNGTDQFLTKELVIQ